MSSPPPSTYRLQLHPDFGLAATRDLIPYLERLGISHVYLSPILAARSGSTHGYDVVDPTRLNPELGDEGELAALAADLHGRGMGLILDIVPNHMATGPENRFWDDVLAHGPASAYARWFDIDWGPGDARTHRRVMLPVLGEPLPRAITTGDLSLADQRGSLRVRYHDQSFPLDPATIPRVLRVGLDDLRERLGRRHPGLRALEDAIRRLRGLGPRHPPTGSSEEGPSRASAADRALDDLRELRAAQPEIATHVAAAIARFGSRAEGGERRLRRLLRVQAYRLAYWRRAARVINYRRFFTLSHLVAIRQEDPAVFQATHARVLDWIETGLFDGVRIDHVDGLLDPSGYLRRLREAVDRAAGPHVQIFVEKILARGERPRADWPVSGTTGYEFLNQVEDLFIDPAGAERIEAAYRRLTGRRHDFGRAAAVGKRRVLTGPLAADVRRLGRLLAAVVDSDDPDRDRGSLASAIVETIVALPVYRTYSHTVPVSAEPDRTYLEDAIREARVLGRAPTGALDALGAALLGGPGASTDTDAANAFLRRFQQTSVPAAAKGVEDTAFYVHVPLASRNEVGGEPDAPLAGAAGTLHEANRERAARWPATLLTVSTHDTKRSADVRSRLDVLSEIPEVWARAVERWQGWNAPHRTRIRGRYAPDRNSEYLLYQTLVGIWPYGQADRAPADVAGTLSPRVRSYMRKAAREAKDRTSWTDPNEEFEAALDGFVRAVLSPDRTSRFLDDVAKFVSGIARPAIWNALSRTLIQLTAPGTPDLYQGDELWNLSLVDPDNRRPVDFGRRRGLLRDLDTRNPRATDGPGPLIEELARTPEDGRIKLYVIHRALRARQRQPDPFRTGDYVPLSAVGDGAEHLFAFARRSAHGMALTVAPRLTVGLTAGRDDPPAGRDVWGDTSIELFGDLADTPRWLDLLTGSDVTVRSAGDGTHLPVAAALGTLPLALLVPAGAG